MKLEFIFIFVILLVGTISATDAHIFTDVNDNVLFNLSNNGNAYLINSFFGGGDVNLPTYSWLGDIDSGMFLIDDGILGWGIGGSTEVLLNSISLNVSSSSDVCITGGNCLSSAGEIDYTNIALTNQSNDFNTFNQTTTGWWNGKFNWVVSFIDDYIFGTFDGETLTVNFNETKLNTTIGQYVSNLTGQAGNTSWNESYADTLYAPNTTVGIQSLINGTGVYSTYNSTYDEIVGNNSYLNEKLTSVNLTTASYDGNIINGSYSGYNAINQICLLEFDGHPCTEFEMIESISLNISLTSGVGWVVAGGPKYAPADHPVSDCSGFTNDGTGSTDPLGNFWSFDSNGGKGIAGNCGLSYPIVCCK